MHFRLDLYKYLLNRKSSLSADYSPKNRDLKKLTIKKFTFTCVNIFKKIVFHIYKNLLLFQLAIYISVILLPKPR